MTQNENVYSLTQEFYFKKCTERERERERIISSQQKQNKSGDNSPIQL